MAPTLSPADDVASVVLRGTRILLVDDSLDNLETFGYLLEHEGAVVTLANSAAEALQLAAKTDLDLVISDIGMPHTDGYQLIAKLRSLARTAAVPAIATTGYGGSHDVQRALAAGFNAHVNKPVDFPRMREVIKALCSGGPPGVAAAQTMPKG